MKPSEHLLSNYQWTVKTPRGIRLLGIAIVVINIAFIVVAFMAADGDWAILIPMAAMLAGGLLGILVAMSHIRISVDPVEVRVGLWPLSERIIRLSELERFECVQNIRPSSFGGIGFRKGPGKKTAYLWGSGEGLELQRTDGESITVVFDEAAEAAEVLENLMTGKIF